MYELRVNWPYMIEIEDSENEFEMFKIKDIKFIKTGIDDNDKVQMTLSTDLNFSKIFKNEKIIVGYGYGHEKDKNIEIYTVINDKIIKCILFNIGIFLISGPNIINVFDGYTCEDVSDKIGYENLKTIWKRLVVEKY